jgi:hypothetical protein
VLDDLKVAIDGARLYPCEAQVAVLSDLFGRERRKRQRRKGLTHDRVGGVAGLVGIKCGVVSGVFNLESSGVEASDWRPRHDKHYHEA